MNGNLQTSHRHLQNSLSPIEIYWTVMISLEFVILVYLLIEYFRD